MPAVGLSCIIVELLLLVLPLLLLLLFDDELLEDESLPVPGVASVFPSLLDDLTFLPSEPNLNPSIVVLVTSFPVVVSK